MSYILDALKKSESERRAGATPGLAPGASYVVLPQHRSRHRGAALMVAVGMLGTGLALGNWRPWQEDLAGRTVPPQGPAPMAAVVAPGAAAAPASAGAESPRLSGAPSAVAAKTPPLVAPKTSTATDRKMSGPPPKEAPVFVRGAPAAHPAAASSGRAPASFRLASLAPALVTAPVPAMAVPAAAVAPVAPIAKATPAVVAPVSGAGAAAVSAPVAVLPPPLVTPAALPAAAPAPVSRVVAYRELPAAVQGALPNIVFGGFAGGGEAEGRVAFINNRLVREGEEVSPGLRLETVDQDGVVLGFQGHHFRTGQ